MSVRPLVNGLVACVVLALLSSASAVRGQEKYRDFNAAMAEGGKHLRTRDYVASREPFEAALRLARDNSEKLKAYEALFHAYRELPEPAPMTEACEFVIANSDTRAKRSIVTRSLTSFFYNRGLVNTAVERYEDVLRDEKDDVVALSLLAEIHKRVKPDEKKAADYATRLAAVDKRLATDKAESLERAAQADPGLAAWNWKEAAVAWQEAQETERAVAAADKSLASAPEKRSGILTYFWRVALGDVYVDAGRTDQAVAQFEAALADAPSDLHRKQIQEKIAAARKPAKPGP
jgi:tetratricopeptide (TPR) repeat protein